MIMKYDVNPITGVPEEYHSTEDIFSDENILGPEIVPADAFSNAIVIGCLFMFLLFALFGACCMIWMAFIR